MELQEMKNVWASVDARLKENEMLNKRIVQEMLHKKSNKSLSKLANYEVFSLVLLVFALPVTIWAFNLPHLTNALFPTITFAVILVVIVYGIISGCYTLLRYFTKIDFSKNVKENMHLVNKYNMFYRKSKLANYFIIIPVFSLLGILSYYELKAPFYLWIFLVVVLITMTIVTYWIYKKVYDTSIQSIKKSLEELEELKEID